MEQAGYRDEWIPYLTEGIQQSIALGDVETTAELELQVGILYQLRSKYEQARTHLEASVRWFGGLDTSRRQASALTQLAYVARMQRRFEEAVSLIETVHQSQTSADEERAFGYYVLGLVALDQRDWPKAVDFSKQAYILWEPANQWRLMGRSLLCRGVALQEMERYSEAITVLEEAIDLFERVHDVFFKAVAQMNLGIVYNWLEHQERAISLFLSAEKIFRQVQDRYHLGLVTHNMGLSYRSLRRWAEAKEAYRQSIAIKKELDNIALMIDDMDGLGLVYLAEGNLAEAETIFQEAMSWLAQIESDPWHAYLLGMVSEHLQEVTQRITQQKKKST
jgi:tetratricopeptide (TPR) repeat protein